MNDNRDELLYFSEKYDNAPFLYFNKDSFTSAEAVVEDFVTAVSATPKKKKRLGRALYGSFKVLLVFAILAVTAYTLIVGSKQEMGLDTYNLRMGNYGKNPTWLADGNSEEVNGIYAQLSQRGALETAYSIYELACQKLSLSKEYSVRARGNIDLMTADIVASGVSNREEHYYVLGEPSLDANQPREYSNQDINFCVDLYGGDIMTSIFQAMMMSGVRSYFDGETVYEQRSKSLLKNEQGEYYAEWRTDYTELEKDFERGYADGDLREKTNFIVSPSTILPGSAKIERLLEDDVFVYNVSFKLDCSSTDFGSATYYEAEAIKRKMGNAESFQFSYMDITFSVYENGYMYFWATKQRYSLRMVLVEPLAFEIAAEMDKQEYLSYDPEECNVVNFVEG